MKPQSLFSPALPPTAGANAIRQSATANPFYGRCLQLMSAWFTLLFKALQSESGSVKFVAQVFCLPRLSSARELANTFVRPACACVCATCLALATCHLARLRHRTSMPACVCARVLTANKFYFRFLHETKTSQADRADYFLSWSPLPVSDASAECGSHFSFAQIACTSSHNTEPTTQASVGQCAQLSSRLEQVQTRFTLATVQRTLIHTLSLRFSCVVQCNF